MLVWSVFPPRQSFFTKAKPCLVWKFQLWIFTERQHWITIDMNFQKRPPYSTDPKNSPKRARPKESWRRIQERVQGDRQSQQQETPSKKQVKEILIFSLPRIEQLFVLLCSSSRPRGESHREMFGLKACRPLSMQQPVLVVLAWPGAAGEGVDHLELLDHLDHLDLITWNSSTLIL